MKHVMVDLETMGTEPYSVIIQVGLAEFDPYEADTTKVIKNSMELTVDPISQVKAGLRMDPDTVMWWMQDAQDEARKLWMKQIKFDMRLTMEGVRDWLKHVETEGDNKPFNEFKSIMMWSNGADFDVPRLSEFYKVGGEPTPWNFRNVRCFRTLKALDRAKTFMPPDIGVKHTALADALHQAFWANNIIRAYSLVV
jgi:hypothetical protein